MNRFGVLCLIAAVVLVTSFSPAYGQSLNPFVGAWSGYTSGEIEAGKREKLKCNAYGSMRGSDLNIRVHCAGTATNGAIRISALVSPNGTGVAGTWQEARFGVSGTLTGSVSGNTLSGRINSPNYNAAVTIQRNGSGLKILVAPTGDALRISVSMAASR